MNEVDEHGWAHIHQAAKKGYFKSVEKFIKASDDQLEFETQDELHETPLMVAIRAGMNNIDTINIIIELGGNLAAVNTLNHGLVEVCCLEGHFDVLEYLVELDRSELPVWIKLLKFCSSESEDEAECAGKALSHLTEPTEQGQINPNWIHVYKSGGILTLIKVVRSSIGDRARMQALTCLINLMMETKVKTQVVESAGLDCLIHQLKSDNSSIVRLTCHLLSILCTVRSYAEQAAQKGVMAALVTALKTITDDEVLVEVVNALGVVCESSNTRQTLFNTTAGSMESLCDILQRTLNPNLLLAICLCVSKITRRHEDNQNSFYKCGGVINIIMLCDIKNKDIQLAAVDTIHMIVESNPHMQKMLVNEGAVGPLISLLNKSKSKVTQEKTAGALWAIAGDDGDERRTMAATMGVNSLIDFLGSLSEILHFIGSEGIGVLAQGAHNKQDAITEANGVHPLVRLLKSDKEYIVLSAIRSIRHLCVGVGYQPHTINQKTVAQARGIKLLNALLALSKSELIQVEAALTLAYIALGNPELMDEIWDGGQHIQFNYLRVLKLLYSTDKVVRLLAGAALATFSYNNMQQQQLIATEGGITFSCFMDFLKCEEEYFRCCAAFQVVVLSRIIPDEEQAVASAVGIKLIVDILNESTSVVIQALAADIIARLAHTRAGVPQALVAIDTVDTLCNLMTSHNSQVRGCASIALAYLAFNHLAERQLLNRCRHDTYLVNCLLYYTDKHKLPDRFKREWKHYRRVGHLPPIQDTRPSLVSQHGHRVTQLATQKKPYISVPSRIDLPNIAPTQEPQQNGSREKSQQLATSSSHTSLSRLSKNSYNDAELATNNSQIFSNNTESPSSIVE